MDEDTTKSSFTEYLEGIDSKLLFHTVDRLKLDRYTKKLFTSNLLKLMIYGQVKQVSSLTDLSLHLNEQDLLKRDIGLPSISTSQLSRRLRDVNPEVFQAVFTQLVAQILASVPPKQKREEAKRLCIVDASTITMCLSTFRWAEFRSTKAGIKLHQRVVLADGETLPEKAILTYARPSDRSRMKELVEVDEDALYLFDRGYVDYRKFDHYNVTGTRFVTRLKHNARVREVEEERHVDPESKILRDAIVWLGHYPGYWMRSKLRLIAVRTEDGETIEMLTNDLDLDATEIAALYRRRWQIELFFKWIKQHLVIKRWYGTSRFAVYNQVWVALITYVLFIGFRRRIKHQGRLLDVYKGMQHHWDKPLALLIACLRRRGERTSRGRRVYNVEAIFAYTVWQYEQGKADHLDDRTYDPVI